ncbi:alpha/beta fold hydrolase [Micromonospora sp. DR5-3]|uniref:thioesterase II family protein n=1 Tax=unclassified Micromonospora TaxID=2617518 RepID=UPI0011D46C3B|nr:MULTISPECIES: alpha/beta fold hydrolase [unclassified Micromonospora]MCW3819604.1 alpha/beta fold hydrolase [Micromonospora sp. DR5-3]TYC20916.1 thioesterase [Micromonospora sp. MP36]
MKQYGPGGLLRCFDPRPLPGFRLVCFPHAGGTAAFFRRWNAALPASAELYAAQYPGREDRLGDPIPQTLGELADAAAEALVPLSNAGLILFGHSMGAALAYEVAQRLERAGRRPELLVVSGRPAPHRQRVETVHVGGDEAILADLRRLGGTAGTVLDDPALRELVLPSLRADYRLIENYWPSDPLPTLGCAVAGFSAADDTEASDEEMRAWADVTTGRFDSRVFPGDHFYLRDAGPAVVGDMLRLLGHAASVSAGWPSTP